VNFIALSLVSSKGMMAFGSWQNQGPKVLFLDEWKSADNTGLSSDIIASWRRLESLLGDRFSSINVHELYVVSGPGSFTGIRVGASFAAGVAFGLGIPAYSINTFDLFGDPVGIPIRAHLAQATSAENCAAANIEFMFQAEAGGVECRLPKQGELLLGIADAPPEFKDWPCQSQLERGLKKAQSLKHPLEVNYGIGPKISGVRV
jgi:hypothetical protein